MSLYIVIRTGQLSDSLGVRVLKKPQNIFGAILIGGLVAAVSVWFYQRPPGANGAAVTVDVEQIPQEAAPIELVSRDPAISALIKEMHMAETLTKIKAPLFTLLDLDGKTVSLEQYRGEIVFLGFWTTW